MISLVMLLQVAGATLIVGLIFINVWKYSLKSYDQNIYLREHGIKGLGHILAVENTNRKLDGAIYPIVKLTLNITLPGEPSYLLSMEVPVTYRDFPTVGMEVNVMVNPKEKKECILNGPFKFVRP